MSSLSTLASRVVACRRCPRLASHREAVAADPPKRYRGQRYWARPIPGFGDPAARLLIVGLAPAAHGGNRTGRMFTGDGSALWLARSLRECGFSSQPTSTHRGDGFTLKGAWITAAVHCAPPANKPTREEFRRCQRFLEAEITLLKHVHVIVALGRIAWDAYLRARGALGQPMLRRKPVFAHGATVEFPDGTVSIASYHPSQQNTFTRKLTRPMLRSVFRKARRLLNSRAG